MTTTHMAGIPAKLTSGRMIQVCILCGEKLLDYREPPKDLRFYAVYELVRVGGDGGRTDIPDGSNGLSFKPFDICTQE